MENLFIRNPKQLKEKIKIIKEDGVNNLHIVSDFDRTLTKYIVNGRKIPSGVSLIREGGYLSKDYVKKAFALFDKYHPIEINKNIPLKEKSQKMQEWWSTHIKLMVEYGMNKSVIENIINKNNNLFREGFTNFLDVLHEYNIPLLIFSSGIGDLIEAFIEKEGKLYENIFIISNFYDYDEKGNVKGYKSDIIHVFNKNEIQLRNKKYLNEIKKRKNVILLGDSIADLGMAEGISPNNIITIGFLNEHLQEDFEIFSKAYDVVLLNDPSMEYVNDLIKNILV